MIVENTKLVASKVKFHSDATVYLRVVEDDKVRWYRELPDDKALDIFWSWIAIDNVEPLNIAWRMGASCA